jgi:hypothetical protein
VAKTRGAQALAAARRATEQRRAAEAAAAAADQAFKKASADYKAAAKERAEDLKRLWYVYGAGSNMNEEHVKNLNRLAADDARRSAYVRSNLRGWADVTAIVRQRIASGQIGFFVTNDTMGGDSNKGVNKQLRTYFAKSPHDNKGPIYRVDEWKNKKKRSGHVPGRPRAPIRHASESAHRRGVPPLLRQRKGEKSPRRRKDGPSRKAAGAVVRSASLRGHVGVVRSVIIDAAGAVTRADLVESPPVPAVARCGPRLGAYPAVQYAWGCDGEMRAASAHPTTAAGRVAFRDGFPARNTHDDERRRRCHRVETLGWRPFLLARGGGGAAAAAGE